MDPTANLEEQRRLVHTLLSGKYTEQDVERFVDLSNALDRWISADNGLPDQWRKAVEGRAKQPSASERQSRGSARR